MSINVKGCSGKEYTFQGPFSHTLSLEDRSGVYLILCQNGNDYKAIDVGESSSVRTRVENHDREDCWQRNCKSTIKYCALYTPNKQQAGRKAIEEDIRCNYNFSCGKR